MHHNDHQQSNLSEKEEEYNKHQENPKSKNYPYSSDNSYSSDNYRESKSMKQMRHENNQQSDVLKKEGIGSKGNEKITSVPKLTDQNPQLGQRKYDYECQPQTSCNSNCQHSFSKTYKTIILTSVIMVLLMIIILGSVAAAHFYTKLNDKIESLQAIASDSRKESDQTKVSSITPLPNSTTTSSIQWVYFDTAVETLRFSHESLKQNVISFDNLVPKQAQYVIVTLWTGNWAVTSWYQYWVKIRVINGNKEFHHNTFGFASPTTSLVFNSEQLIIPCSQTRQIRVKTTKIQTTGGQVRFYITGWGKQTTKSQ